MCPRSLHRNGELSYVVLTVVGLFSACSPGDGSERPAAVPVDRACSTPADSVVGLAAKKFVGFVSPKPHRFLIPVSTDSALPSGAYWALQTTGATLNMYPRDTTAQKQLRRQLGANGSYTLLLMNYHGQKKTTDGRVALEFSGHYLSGSVDGTAIPRTAVMFSCHAAGERFVIEPALSGA